MKLTIVSAFALALLATGCSFGQGQGAQYEGLYAATGTNTLTWSGGSATDIVNGNRTLAEGLTSDLVYAEEDCAFPADIEGKTATFTPNTTCTVFEDGYSTTLTVTSGTLSLSESMVTVNLSGTFTLSGPEGSANGTFTFNETLTRKSK